MEDGLLSLKWNNHRSTFFHILSEVRGKQTYTDATLACEGKFFPVHKLVMSTCSDYFAEIFEKTPCKNPVVVLKDIKKSDLEALLDYMYIGEVDVRQSELAGLIKAAECLRIKGLAVPDEDPTKAHKKAPTTVPERREDSPPAKRKRRDSGGDRGRVPSPPLPRGSSQSSSHTSTTPVPSQAPPPSSSVPESHVPSQPMPPPPSLGQEAGRPRSDAPPSSHLHHPPLSSVRGAAESLRSPPGGPADSHGAGTSPRTVDPSILPVQMIKVEVDEAGESGGAGKEGHDGGREEGSELDDNEEEGSNDFSEYQGHPGEIEKEEHDQVESYTTDQLPGPSGLQGAPPVLSWGEEGEGGFPHNLFGSDDAAAAQQAAVQRAVAALGGGRLVCPMCPRTFPSVEELGRHIPMHTFDKLYRCQQCFYRTDSRSNLLRHLRTHTGEKRHGCPVCPYRAGQRSDLRRHLRVHALKQFNNIFRCRLCDETSPSATAFARHILESHSRTPQGENHDEDPQDIPQDPLEDPRTLPSGPTGQDNVSSNSPKDSAATGDLDDPTEDPLDDS
ncbi:zinc finger and SCAN domain-containing protein 10-like isoform X2 [Portunus trituberculatus]|uniref:zinc finger and SCAN domain-containing protein 10-like isoform X2 n=1 Tax=Portunus trituberculatus TaxID=210409 RepID=UPI001E1CF573|nr:zinc finger and SCAN domain-containing protein 10-like isoform X2 [Portunus trituberculatus]